MRSLLLLLFVCGVASGLELRPLADHVWQYTTSVEMEGWGLVPANGLLIAAGDTMIMVDTPWNDSLTVNLMDHMEQQQQRVSQWLIIPTHFHDDCMGGLAAAHLRGAESIALDSTRAIAESRGLPLPLRVFSGDTSLVVNGQVLDLFWPGGAHTSDNIVVYLPESELLFGGCMIKCTGARSLGNLQDADLPHWSAALDAVVTRFGDSVIVVPGHGPAGGRELLYHTKQLLEAQE